MKTLEAVAGVVALNVAKVEGALCAVVACEGYEAYQSLPAAVVCEGVLMGKTGWNSDTNHAFYSSAAKVLRSVS